MQMPGIVTLVYGVLLVVGGAMGFAKAQSMPSLLSGVIAGALALVGGAMTLRGSQSGVWLALVVAVVIGLFGAVRVFAQGKGFMPAGLMMVLSIIELLVLLPALRRGGA